MYQIWYKYCSWTSDMMCKIWQLLNHFRTHSKSSITFESYCALQLQFHISKRLYTHFYLHSNSIHLQNSYFPTCFTFYLFLLSTKGERHLVQQRSETPRATNDSKCEHIAQPVFAWKQPGIGFQLRFLEFEQGQKFWKTAHGVMKAA